MSWAQTAVALPASLARIHSASTPLISSITAEQAQALARLEAPAARAQYRPGPLCEAAIALLGLRQELEALLTQGQIMTVTPFMPHVGHKQGEQWALSADNAIKAMVGKLRDSADPLCPDETTQAVLWLVSGEAPGELARALVDICRILPLPTWCAAARQLLAQNDTMAMLAAPTAPHWTPAEPLAWNPLRQGRQLIGAEVAQLESLAAGHHTPLARLQQLAARRETHLQETEHQLDALARLSGQLWRWHGSGTPEAIATQLEQAGPPTPHSMTAGALLLGQDLTVWRELTP